MRKRKCPAEGGRPSGRAGKEHAGSCSNPNHSTPPEQWKEPLISEDWDRLLPGTGPWTSVYPIFHLDRLLPDTKSGMPRWTVSLIDNGGPSFVVNARQLLSYRRFRTAMLEQLGWIWGADFEQWGLPPITSDEWRDQVNAALWNATLRGAR
jgi:hypothetical protein